MRVLAAAALSVLIMASCASSSPTSAAQDPAPSSVKGIWDFVVTGKRQTQSFSFALTDTPADTCISGNWLQAQSLSAPQGQTSRPAYHYQSGKLEILLSTELCDANTSFIGNVSGSTFEGSYVSYSLFGGTEHGKVSGALRQ